MLKYIDKNEYIKLLGANYFDIPDNFEKLVIEASNYINAQTFNRIDVNNISEQVKYVTCLIIDLINEAENKKNEMGNLKSQNIEGWSETYQTVEEIDNKLEKDKYNTLKIYFYNIIGSDGNFLLYRGGC